MHGSFFRTLRSLGLERTGPGWGSALALLTIALWAGWALLARVPVLEVSQQARIEIDAPPHPLPVSRPGRLLRLRLALDQRVRAGEVLAEVESSVEEARLGEQRAVLAGLARQIAALDAEIAALGQLRRADLRSAGVAGEVAAARTREAQQRSLQAEDAAARLSRLRGAAPEIDVVRAQAEAQARQATRDSMDAEVRHTRAERTVLLRQARVRQAEARRDLAALAGQRAAAASAIAALEAEIEAHRVRAPLDGVIGAVTPLSPGAFVQAGDSLGVLLPAQGLHVVAHYLPAAAFGRVRPGQRGWLRLSGFPWTQYGRVPLQVTGRADEVHDGLVRVTLAIAPGPFPVPLQHGMPGAVDIEAELASPFTLLLRAAGRGWENQ